MQSATTKGFLLRARQILLAVTVTIIVSQLTACAPPLHKAAGAGDINMLTNLLDNNLDINESNFFHGTPLHKAAKSGKAETATLLIKRGADVNAKSFLHVSPLYEAVLKSHIEIAKLLIEHGADVNARDNGGWPLLSIAIVWDLLESAKLLIENGADVNATTNGGWTPLHWAANRGHTETVTFLIERGADLNAKTSNNSTPLHLAAGSGHTKTAKLLIENGADIFTKNKSRKTAFDIARDQRQHETSAFIIAAMNNTTYTPTTKPTAVAPTPKVTSIVNTPPTLRMPVNPKAYAVVIGIEKYREQLPNASYAESDAQTVAKYLTDSMGFEKRNVAVLTNDRATKSDIEKHLGTWLKNRANKPGSKVFIYYSGHGAPDVKTKSAYLVPYDGDPTYISDTGYPLKKLYDNLGKLKAKEIVVALDSCFSGAGGRSVIANGARPLALKLDNPLVSSGKIIVLSASSGSQASSTYEAKGHGLFTYYLLKGLHGGADANKSGKISVKELYKYISPKVETIALEEYNNEQTPQLIDPSRKSGKMVLIGK